MPASNRAGGTRSFRDRLGLLRGDFVGRLDYLELALLHLPRGRRSGSGSAHEQSQPDAAPPTTARSQFVAEPGAALGNPPGARSVDHAGHGRRCAVIAWDVGHNPLGRAHVLAGVLKTPCRRRDLGGPVRALRHRSVWAPLRDSRDPDPRLPRAATSRSTSPSWRRWRSEIDADAIYVSKPRLPSYGLGILAKEARNRPLLLDVDDHELAFFDEDDGLHLRDVLAMRGDPDLTLAVRAGVDARLRVARGCRRPGHRVEHRVCRSGSVASSSPTRATSASSIPTCTTGTRCGAAWA